MRLFLISNMYPTPQMPGFGVFVKNVADGLERYGCRIKYSALIYGRGRNRKEKLWKYCQFYWEILVKFLRGDYDVIYIHYPNMALPILLFLLKIRKKEVVVNLHGEDLFYPTGGFVSKLGKWNEKFLKRYAKCVIVPSVFFEEELLRRNVCEKERIFISPSGGINSHLFYSLPRRQHAKICLGYVGRIDDGKGWKEYIEALYILNDCFDFDGIMIGYGSEEKLRDALLDSYHLKDKVAIVRGVEQKELCTYYNRFDLLLFTTQLPESLGLVGLEAMACGTPVVGTNIGGIPSYLKNRYNGFLVSPNDKQAVCNAVMEYMAMSHEDKNIMKQNCLLTAQNYYAEKVVNDLAKKFEALFGENQ